MSSKHTPGPWTWGWHGDDWSLPVSVTANRQGEVAFIDNRLDGFKHGNRKRTHEDQMANINLICAAPDLLEACQDALLYMPRGDVYLGVVEKLNAAVSKALGETQ